MIEVHFSPSFKRAFKKKIKGRPELEEIFYEKLQIFIDNPFDLRLKTHKLSGKLKDMWSFSINYQIRVVFTFVNSDIAIFEDFGTHNSVY